jgi:hypothetical protein
MIKDDCAEEKILELVHALKAGELSSDDLLRHASHAFSYDRNHCE